MAILAEFRKQIRRRGRPHFWASGISLIATPGTQRAGRAMNTRMVVTPAMVSAAERI